VLKYLHRNLWEYLCDTQQNLVFSFVSTPIVFIEMIV